MPPKPILSKKTNLLKDFLQKEENRNRFLKKFIFDNNKYIDSEYYEVDKNNLIINYDNCYKEIQLYVNFKHTEKEILLLEFSQPDYDRYGQRIHKIQDIIHMQHKITLKIEQIKYL